MAERGGRRTPPARTPPAGPGRFSRRDERAQPIREPDIDRPDLDYGDRQRLTEAQRIAAVPRSPSPRPEPRPQGEPTLPGRLPPWLFQLPTAFPEEPPTAGLPLGPGPGPEALELRSPPEDVREQVLLYLAANYDNADAKMLLHQLREERAARRPVQTVEAPRPGIPVPVTAPEPAAAPEEG